MHQAYTKTRTTSLEEVDPFKNRPRARPNSRSAEKLKISEFQILKEAMGEQIKTVNSEKQALNLQTRSARAITSSYQMIIKTHARWASPTTNTLRQI